MECEAPFLHVALYEPEIAPNTGNLIRLCANCGARLHLIHPLGFELNDKRLRRAGLDYHEYASVAEYDHFDDFMQRGPKGRIFACSTKGTQSYDAPAYQAGDILLLGPESRGLPAEIRSADQIEAVIRLPMRADSRSLNLSNATAIIVYEAWRQLGFPGGSNA